ncbi:MAG: prepilin-type N-terminal cleavage/methylation domain-containing protein, partial [Pseudomonadota bacterium]
MTPPGRESGFTLLELLVAITLLGVLMAALFGALRLGNKIWDTGEARLDAIARVQVVQDFLRRQLAQTVPLDEPSEGSSVFLGAKDSVRFVSFLPEHLGGGVSLLELALAAPQNGAEHGNLVIRINPIDLDTEAVSEADAEERVLIEQVEALELAYFGAARPNAEPIWWQEWEAQQTLPRLIRMKLQFPEGDGRRWPELIVGIRVDL